MLAAGANCQGTGELSTDCVDTVVLCSSTQASVESRRIWAGRRRGKATRPGYVTYSFKLQHSRAVGNCVDGVGWWWKQCEGFGCQTEGAWKRGGRLRHGPRNGRAWSTARPAPRNKRDQRMQPAVILTTALLCHAIASEKSSSTSRTKQQNDRLTGALLLGRCRAQKCHARWRMASAGCKREASCNCDNQRQAVDAR